VNQQYPPGAFFLTRIPGRTGWWVGLAQAICGMPSRWTHAGIVLPDDRILQAQPGGAVIAPLDSLTGRPHIVSDAPIRLYVRDHPEDSEWFVRRSVTHEALNLEGTPYSFADYLALAAIHLHLPSKALRRYVENSGHLISSALLDRTFREAGIHLYDDGRYPGDVTPADLDAWAQDHQPYI
jgi:hypothetical protein